VEREGRAVIVREYSTAVRRRILVRYKTEEGRTLSPIHTLSSAIKAREPDIALGRDGSFMVAEQFPSVKTVVRAVRLTPERASS